MSSNIKQLLESFRESLFKEEDFRDSVIDILKEKISVSLERKCVIFRNNIISIQTDSYIKTEIFLKKDDILKHIQTRHPKRNVLDIF